MGLRMLEPGDIPEAMRISKVQLGDDYLDETDFREALESEGTFCCVATVDGKLAGFAICQVFGPEGEGKNLGLPDGPERDSVLAQRRIGLLDSVSVDSEFEGHGIGAEMCSRCIDVMRERGCTMACAMAWKYVNGHTNIAGILTRLGFEETIAIQGYWNRMVSSPEGHHCPICGAPCRCYGVFWRRCI